MVRKVIPAGWRVGPVNLTLQIDGAQVLRAALIRDACVGPCGSVAGPLTPDSQMSHPQIQYAGPAALCQEEMTDMAEPVRARPKPTPETQHFWDGARAGELRLQRCDDCSNVYFPPRPFCPSCASRKVSVFKA